jgi:hypothetical protein
LISSITDSTGRYEINDIPTGTYNLIVSKESYGEFQQQGFQVVGGEEPLYFDCQLIKISTTTIGNLSLEIENSSSIYLKGNVKHNYTFSGAPLKYFIHKINNPSKNNYLQSGGSFFYGESGSEFYSEIYIDNNLFPSGSKVFIIAYGSNIWYNSNDYYDILSNHIIDPNLGMPSNIASITIP